MKKYQIIYKVDGWDCWGNEVESDIDLELKEYV